MTVDHSKKLSTNSMFFTHIYVILVVIYMIGLSGVFDLYARGGYLNHEVWPSGLNTHLEHINHEKLIHIIYNNY